MFPEIEVIAEAANASEGVEKIDALPDLNLPGYTGCAARRDLHAVRIREGSQCASLRPPMTNMS